MNILRLKVVLTSIALLAAIGCGGGGSGGAPHQEKKCCDALNGFTITDTNSTQCSSCCTPSGAPVANPPDEANCPTANGTNASKQAAEAFASTQRAVGSLNEAQALLGGNDNGVGEEASLAATAGAGSLDSFLKKVQPKGFTKNKGKGLKDIDRNSNGGSGGGGGRFGGGAKGFRSFGDVGKDQPDEVTSVSAAPSALQPSEDGTVYGGGSAPARAGKDGSVGDFFKSAINGGNGASLTSLTVGGSRDPAAAGDVDDYFQRISIYSDLFQVIERKYRDVSFDWAERDARRALARRRSKAARK